MSKHHYIAVDLGAESGRVMLGVLDRGELQLEEHHRFPNLPVHLAGHDRWGILQLWHEITVGIGKATKAAGGPEHIRGISCDSWGVDYVLVGRGSPMLAPPCQYRDPRTEPHFERALSEIGRAAIFEQTGIQFMAINTLFQLMSEPAELLKAAEKFVPIGDYINWLLAGGEPHAGQPRCEVSLASTTQAFDVSKRDWAHGLIERAGLPKHVFPDVVDSGTVLGQHDLGGQSAAKVIATCSHDTGCAVAATPGQPRDDGYWAFLSSGTWSLLGVEIDAPVVDDRCRELNFTNEQGYRGSTRLLKNISGLYLLQQCRAAWAEADKAYGYHELAPMADDAPPLVSLIRPECGEFAKPGRMPEKIADYCRRTGQPVPETVGAHVRCIYESLALLYRKTVGELTELTGKSIKTLNIVGGGTQAMLLNQLAADACGIPAVIGPIEATAFGNVLIQAATLGDITPDDIRPIVRRSTSLETCEPKNAETMAAAYDRFVALPTE